MQLLIDIRSGLIGLASALITVVTVVEYYNRPKLQRKVQRVLWGVNHEQQ